MTNEAIIMNESVALMEEGKLRGSGRYIKVEDENGNTKELELPEPIHTYQGWKQRGMQVKKGEHSDIQFMIWKQITRKIKDENGNETKKDQMIMKMSHFFTRDQVEPIA